MSYVADILSGGLQDSTDCFVVGEISQLVLVKHPGKSDHLGRSYKYPCRTCLRWWTYLCGNVARQRGLPARRVPRRRRMACPILITTPSRHPAHWPNSVQQERDWKQQGGVVWKHEPQTSGTQRAVVKAIIINLPSKRIGPQHRQPRHDPGEIWSSSGTPQSSSDSLVEIFKSTCGLDPTDDTTPRGAGRHRLHRPAPKPLPGPRQDGREQPVCLSDAAPIEQGSQMFLRKLQGHGCGKFLRGEKRHEGRSRERKDDTPFSRDNAIGVLFGALPLGAS